MKKILLILPILSILFFSSCDSDPCGSDKKDFLNKFNAFVEKVDNAELSSKDAKWEEYDTQFKKYVEECYEIHADELTNKEEREFWAKTITYYGDRYGKGLASALADEANNISKLIGEHTSSFSKELKLFLNDLEVNEGELKENLNELGDDLEKLGKKWGKRLENFLEEHKDK